MAKPMTAIERLQAFKRWGVPIFDHTRDWMDHNRNSQGEWGPVHGIMIHHTGDDARDKLDFRVLFNGRSDLPGPLCHWGMDDKGRVWNVGNGRANHAGRGNSKVLDAVISGLFGKFPPNPLTDTEDGNRHFYGQETMYSGARPMTGAKGNEFGAYDSTIRVCAAICEFHEWTGKSVIGHKEWTRRKPDPGKTNMADLRADVNHALLIGPTKARRFNFRNN